MGDPQWPLAFAKPVTPRNRSAIPAAIAQAGSDARFGRVLSIFGRLIARASCAGQTATHSRQPVHSTERIWTSLSTGRAEGHALAHFAQSMQVRSFLRMRAGLSQDVRPRSAP